jgi:DnaK suppressor protein
VASFLLELARQPTTMNVLYVGSRLLSDTGDHNWSDYMRQAHQGAEEIRHLLIGERDSLRARVKTLREEQEQEALTTPGDEMDVAKSLLEVETHASLIERAEETLLEIESALDRVDDGGYGICIDCGEDIPIERLKAIPFTTYCVDCKSKLSAEASSDVAPTERKAYRRWTPPLEADPIAVLSDEDNSADQLSVKTMALDDEADLETSEEDSPTSRPQRRGRSSRKKN